MGARSGAVGNGTVLQAGMSRFRFPLWSLIFVIEIILPVRLRSWVYSASNRTEYQGYLLGVCSCIGLATLSSTRADCLQILRASTSWNPQGPSRPVKGSFTFTSQVLNFIFDITM
jgi:hypothetical protein